MGISVTSMVSSTAVQERRWDGLDATGLTIVCKAKMSGLQNIALDSLNGRICTVQIDHGDLIPVGPENAEDTYASELYDEIGMVIWRCRGPIRDLKIRLGVYGTSPYVTIRVFIHRADFEFEERIDYAGLGLGASLTHYLYDGTGGEPWLSGIKTQLAAGGAVGADLDTIIARLDTMVTSLASIQTSTGYLALAYQGVKANFFRVRTLADGA